MALPEVNLKIMECKQGAVRAVRFNVDGGYCLTCGSDKTIKLWNPYRATLVHTYSGHGYEVLDARGSTDNSMVVSCGLDKSVMVWAVSTGQVLRKYRGHVARVNTVAFNDDSTVALSGSVDGSVRCWDMRSRSMEPIQTLNEAKDSVMSVVVNGHEVLTASLDGFSRLYDLRNGQLTTNCIGESITCAALSGDGQLILASCSDSSLRLLDKDSGELLGEYPGLKCSGYRLESCFSTSDTHVLSGSEDGNIYCWDLVTAKLVTKLEHLGSKVIHSLSPHPTEPLLLTASLGQVWFWGPQENDEEPS